MTEEASTACTLPPCGAALPAAHFEQGEVIYSPAVWSYSTQSHPELERGVCHV